MCLLTPNITGVRLSINNASIPRMAISTRQAVELLTGLSKGKLEYGLAKRNLCSCGKDCSRLTNQKIIRYRRS